MNTSTNTAEVNTVLVQESELGRCNQLTLSKRGSYDTIHGLNILNDDR
jgi:hypothetical protein